MSQMALPPARDTNVDHHQHIHNHIHSHPHNNGHHSHSSTNSTLAAPLHAQRHNHRHAHAHHHARSASQHSLPQNRPRANSDTVVVIETVSVIQLIDATGSTIALSTLPPSPPRTTTLIGTSTHLPAASGVAPDLPAQPSGIEASLSFGVPTGPGNGVDTTLSLPPLDPTESPLDSSMPTTFPTLSYSPLTSTPLSGGPIFPTFGGVTNSTTTQAIATPSIPNNGTVSYSAFATLSPGPEASSSADLTSSPLATTSSTDSEATSATRSSTGSFMTGITTASSYGGAATPWVGISDDGNTSPAATPESSDQPSSTPPATIAGSVIGSIAGLAMLLFLALALMRYKRRRMEQSLESGGTARALTAGSGGNSGGGYGAMSERPRSIPFAVPGALAALTGMRRSRQSETPPSTAGTGERGFSKVSGRKLPPVIQFGGDGYTDPRDTMMTDASSGGVSYRDSNGIFANPNQKFAVGAPMRPESGMPVFHNGPSRSPRIDEGPFSDAGPYVRTDSPTLIPPRNPNLDPLGRSHAGISQDGSNRSTLSVSRFTENL